MGRFVMPKLPCSFRCRGSRTSGRILKAAYQFEDAKARIKGLSYASEHMVANLKMHIVFIWLMSRFPGRSLKRKQR